MKHCRCIFSLFFLLILTLAANQPARSQVATDGAWDRIAPVMERLSVSLPLGGMPRTLVIRYLEELSREPCDQEAIVNLAKALQNAGFRRDSATAHIRFSETCGGHADSLKSAVNILLNLSDHAAAAKVATDLIALEPFDNNGYYLRALAYDKGGFPKKAIDDYQTAIELFGNKDAISSVAYFNMARNYEKLGQFCDAILPIEAWIAINPGRNDNSQTRAMISNQSNKGQCADGVTGVEDVFSVARRNDVLTIPVTVNGVRGQFILDTGATFVSVKQAFAEKANVDIDHDTMIKLHTANGIGEGKRGRAKSIRLRTIQADNVPVIVQADRKGLFGDGVDGLLGMSFLSRFNVVMDGKQVRIRKRQVR